VIGTSIAGPTTRERANTLMAALAVSSSTGSTAIAPRLSLVLLMCAQTNYMDYNTYYEMVNSRWQAADCALKSAAQECRTTYRVGLRTGSRNTSSFAYTPTGGFRLLAP
jgi:hypothetical protein